MRPPATVAAMLWMVGLIVVVCVSVYTSQVCAQGTRWEHYMAEGAKAYQSGQETNAEMFYLAALEDVHNASPEDPRLAATLNALAVLYHAQSKYAQAEPLYQRVLALMERTLGPDHPNLAATLDNYADLLHKMQREAEAEAAEARAKAIWAKQKREPGGK
jgi:tetratricopeptide (TPR) repeat protein